MKRRIEQASQWCYRGLWGVLTRWFHVPDQPPSLPSHDGETVEAFQPSEGFLRYLRFLFWVGLFVIDLAIMGSWLVIAVINPLVGGLLLVPALLVAIVPDILAYLAIHLRYDTTWYVMTDRSIRIRRGIWIIHETTITFDNVQNVIIRQGPLQRWFGIANVLIETAGGGGHQQQEGQAAPWQTAHCGLIEGIADASRIRDLLLRRLRRSRGAGLGDDVRHEAAGPAWTAAQVALLREIRDLLRRRAVATTHA